MKYKFLSLLFLFSLETNSQENLVQNGGFEEKLFPLSPVDHTNPPIPCRRGGFEHIVIPYWLGFGYMNTTNDAYSPDLFDVRFSCSNQATICSGNPCNGQDYGGVSAWYS